MDNSSDNQNKDNNQTRPEASNENGNSKIKNYLINFINILKIMIQNNKE